MALHAPSIRFAPGIRFEAAHCQASPLHYLNRQIFLKFDIGQEHRQTSTLFRIQIYPAGSWIFQLEAWGRVEYCGPYKLYYTEYLSSHKSTLKKF